MQKRTAAAAARFPLLYATPRKGGPRNLGDLAESVRRLFSGRRAASGEGHKLLALRSQELSFQRRCLLPNFSGEVLILQNIEIDFHIR
jgi:hypothetical protein